MIYNDWLKNWLNNYVYITVKHRTFVRYKEIVINHIENGIGKKEMNELTAMDLQKYITGLITIGNKLTGKKLASSTINSIITVLQGSFNAYYRLGMIENNPASNIKRYKIIEKKLECFSLAEQKKIEQFVLSENRSYMFGIILCLYTGLRIGELLALTWQDINFKNNTLSITKTCYDGVDDCGKFGRIIDSPKTKSSWRIIPLPKSISLLLKYMKSISDSNWVISKKGNPLSIRTYQRNFSVILEKLKIQHRGFHALRHTFATRAIECGMDVKTLSEILGHKNATITLNRYVHSLLEHKRNMMNKLGKLCDLSHEM